LGLFIVHQTVLAHGGTITVTSSAADGTTFTITLPRTTPARDKPATTVASASSS
jgi:sigma-B regulation protein RsbU (phosphoserine phosphatase)